MGKYQLDSKSQVAVAKFHEKQKPAKFDKKQQLEKLRIVSENASSEDIYQVLHEILPNFK